MKNKAISLGLAATLSACVSTGPSTSEIVGNKDAQVVNRESNLVYGVLSMDAGLASLATSLKRSSERKGFIRRGSATDISLGVGDQIQVTIVSTNDTGFLDIANSSLAPISSTSLPPQNVGPDGMISIPPIGRIRAAGNSVQGFENLLTRRLGEVLVEPTAIVQLVDRKSAQITMVGAIGAPGTYSINQDSRHLVEAIAQAGGAAGAADDMRVVMTRSGHTGTANLKDVYEVPKLNVHLRAGDVIRFEPFVGQFTVLGAGGVNSNLQFSTVKTNLVNALGQSGGILTNRADPRGVFIYRVMSRDAAARLGVGTSQIVTESVPVIFQFDMKKPESLFIAREFEISDGDILYISTSIISEVNAALAAFGSILPSPREVVTASSLSN